MDRKSFSDIGGEIKDIVQDAINTRDFNRLNTEIANTVNHALNEFRRSIAGFESRESHDGMGETAKDGKEKELYRNQTRRRQRTAAAPNESRRMGRTAGQSGWKVVKNASGRYVYTRTGAGCKEAGPLQERQPVKIVKKIKGRAAGILFTVFGSVGLSAGLLTAIIVGGICLSKGESVLFFLGLWLALGLPFLAAGFIMLPVGRFKLSRIQRYKVYLNQIGARGYCRLSELAAAVGRKEKYVVRDLRKMIGMDLFPEGHIDKDETCFIANQETYGLYLNMLESEEERGDTAPGDAGEEAGGEAERVVLEGREYIRQIRAANEAIPGEKISGKLSRLELVTDKIFYFIEQHPQKIPDIHRFMEYYLPTTLKLVNTYREFDSQPVQGENITVGKGEIEDTLDTIIEAFSSLLDSMFEEAALDVSTDISVLRTMFAQEGLTKKDFVHKG